MLSAKLRLRCYESRAKFRRLKARRLKKTGGKKPVKRRGKRKKPVRGRYRFDGTMKSGKELEDAIRKGKLHPSSKEGILCKTIKDMIVKDLGGPAKLNNKQWILLDVLLVPKLVFYYQIAEWNLKQKEIIDEKGNLSPSLAHGFLSYAAEIRRDLGLLYSQKENPQMDKRMAYAKVLMEVEKKRE